MPFIQLPDPIPNPQNISWRTAYAEALINAPRQLVWDMIIDVDTYTQWNPFTFDVVTDGIIQGGHLTFSVRMSKRYIRHQKENIHCVDEPHLIVWGAPPMLGVEPLRVQMLTETTTHHTLYRTWETFPGWLGYAVRFGILASVQRGFEDMAQALKQHSEQRWQFQSQ